MKDKLITALLVLVLLIGVSVLLYPTVSNYLNERNQASAIVRYDEVLSEISEEDFERFFASAVKFNENIAKNYYALDNANQIVGYEDELDVTGTNIMGYITIPKINVTIPIYHGTEESVLQTSVGHMKGSSLPVGGESTHAVLSGHRGLPSAKLFSDLDKMEIGDEFSIAVLNRIIKYKVDQILIVEPDQMENLRVVKGEDYCTLLTCTPYGVNSHRLLVRGKRVIDVVDEKPVEQVYITGNAIPISQWITVAILSAPVLFILFIIVVVAMIKNRNIGGMDEETEEKDSQ